MIRSRGLSREQMEGVLVALFCTFDGGIGEAFKTDNSKAGNLGPEFSIVGNPLYLFSRTPIWPKSQIT